MRLIETDHSRFKPVTNLKEELKQGVTYYTTYDMRPNVYNELVVDLNPFTQDSKGKKYSPQQKKTNIERYLKFFKSMKKSGQLFIGTEEQVKTKQDDR